MVEHVGKLAFLIVAKGTRLVINESLSTVYAYLHVCY